MNFFIKFNKDDFYDKYIISEMIMKNFNDQSLTYIFFHYTYF